LPALSIAIAFAPSNVLDAPLKRADQTSVTCAGMTEGMRRKARRTIFWKYERSQNRMDYTPVDSEEIK
jgi:hypothetical protein